MSFPCIPSRRFPPSLYAILHANRRPAIRHGKSRRGTRSCDRGYGDGACDGRKSGGEG